jgi:hypothetical protein
LGLCPTIRDGDWNSVRKAIQLLSSNLRLGNQAIPTFGGGNINGNLAVIGAISLTGGLTVSGALTSGGVITGTNFISSIAVGTAPFSATSTTVCPNLNASLLEGHNSAYFQTAGNYQPLDADLSAIAALNFVSTSFLKKTAADTWALDTNTYYKLNDSPTFANITDSGLAITRVPYASTAGLLIDSANLTFNGTTLKGTSIVSTGQVAFNTTAIVTGKGIYSPFVDTTNLSVIGADVNATSTKTGNLIFVYCQKFVSTFAPIKSATKSTTASYILGAYGQPELTLATDEPTNYTCVTAAAYYSTIVLTGSTTGGGRAIMTTAAHYWALAPTLNNANCTITALYAFYDAGQNVPGSGTITAAWGLGINTQSYINGNLRIGSAVVPTVTLDVTGAGLFSTTLGVTGLITATGGLSLPAAANIALATTTGTKIGTATNQLLGFYNATPIIQPSGNILTALSNLGLVASPTITETDPIVAAVTGIVKSNGTTIGAAVSGTDIKTVNSTSLLGSGDVAVQATLVSATNIKTVNSTTLLGSGDLAVQPTLVSATNIKSINGSSILASGDLTLLTTSFVDRGDPSVWDFNLRKEEGTATSTSANHLVDATATFQTNGVVVNDYVNNTTDNTWAKVTAVNSEIDLTLDADIMTNGESYYTGSFKTDGGTYQLDMSSIIPTGAKAVAFTLDILSSTVGHYFQMRKNGQSNWYNRIVLRTQAINTDNDSNAAIGCSSNRIFDYSSLNAEYTLIGIGIIGWWI